MVLLMFRVSMEAAGSGGPAWMAKVNGNKLLLRLIVVVENHLDLSKRRRLRKMGSKMLKDYPRNKWMEAADGCDFCGAKYQLMITSVDETGNFGTIQVKIKHNEGCYEMEMYSDEEVREDIVGWEFFYKPVKILGKEYIPIGKRANIGPCLNCGKLVVGVPFILFIDRGKGGELDFCFTCAQKLGILDNLRGQ